MRDTYQKQLMSLHSELIKMGALCEDAIKYAIGSLLEKSPELRTKAIETDCEIDEMEKDIESKCVRLILREQPVAGDLRQIVAAQKMITDMERIGDQASDIAQLSVYLDAGGAISSIHIADMAEAAISMLAGSVDAFVESNINKANEVIAYDDVVDDLFIKIRSELIDIISKNSSAGGECLDMLMIAKYLERIGDHACNIAEWTLYAVSGEQTPVDSPKIEPPLSEVSSSL